MPRHELGELALVSKDGRLFLGGKDQPTREVGTGQLVLDGSLPLVRPYRSTGPHLLEPRPALRIIPGKLAGEPHIRDTRIPTAMIFSMHRAGYSEEQVLRMYPAATASAIADAIDLESSLRPVAA